MSTDRANRDTALFESNENYLKGSIGMTCLLRLRDLLDQNVARYDDETVKQIHALAACIEAVK